MTATPAPAPPATEKAEKGTRYHVFKERGDSSGAVYVPVEPNVTASSDQMAIRQVAKDNGTYIAIPVRSFKPTKVTVETTKTVKLG